MRSRESCRARAENAKNLASALVSPLCKLQKPLFNAMCRVGPAIAAADMDPLVGPSSQETGCRLAYVYITGSLSREEQIPSNVGDCERTKSHEHASTSGQCNGVEGHVLPSVRGARYTAALLKSTLMLMGCKPRVAHKVQLCGLHHGYD